MTDDDKALVERLRATYRKEYAPTGSTVAHPRLVRSLILSKNVLYNPDGNEAADRIETLNAMLAAAEECLGDQLAARKEQADRIEVLNGLFTNATYEAAEMMKEIERLREALRDILRGDDPAIPSAIEHIARAALGETEWRS